MNDQNGTTSSDTLRGWKDIGNYLGRSPRAVQRWERELGLPVHRIKADDGQTVYALKNEIDDWVKSRDLPRPQPEDDDATGPFPNGNGLPAAPDPPVPAAPPHAVRRRSTWLTVSAFAALTLVVGLVLGRYFQSPFRGPLTSVQVTGTSVTTFDADGRVVWRTEMGGQVSQPLSPAVQSATIFPERSSGSPLGSDIVVPMRFGSPSQSAVSDAFVNFDARGKVRWTVQPNLTLSCGTQTFSGPWQITTWAVVSQDTTHPRLWVAFNHNTYWPGILMEVDADGHSKLRYLQTGWIRGFSEWTSARGHLLAANGVLNEFELASTTLFDPDGPAVTSPHSDARFSCTESPTAMPAAVYLWPKLDVQGPEAYAMATSLKPLADGLQVLLEQGGGGTLIELDREQHVRSLSLPDTYWVIHRQRQSEGWIKHPAESCPERDRAMPIETWSPKDGWTHSTIVPTNRQTVLTK